MTPEEAGQRIRMLADRAAEQLYERQCTTATSAVEAVVTFLKTVLPTECDKLNKALPNALESAQSGNIAAVFNIGYRPNIVTAIVETIADCVEEQSTKTAPHDVEFDTPQRAMDRAIVAVCSNVEARANDPKTTPAELKDLADSVGKLLASTAPKQEVHAADIAALEAELVSSRMIAAEIGAECDSLKDELSKVRLNYSENLNIAHTLLDAAGVDDGQINIRVRTLIDERDALKAQLFLLEQNQNNIVGEKVAAALDELNKTMDEANAPRKSVAGRVKWIVDELARLRNLALVNDVSAMHKLLDDANVPAGHIVERVKAATTVETGCHAMMDQASIPTGGIFFRLRELIRTVDALRDDNAKLRSNDLSGAHKMICDAVAEAHMLFDNADMPTEHIVERVKSSLAMLENLRAELDAANEQVRTARGLVPGLVEFACSTGEAQKQLLALLRELSGLAAYWCNDARDSYRGAADELDRTIKSTLGERYDALMAALKASVKPIGIALNLAQKGDLVAVDFKAEALPFLGLNSKKYPAEF